MTIENPDEYVKNLWNWGLFDDCFGGRIRMMDIDGAVERNGRFLVVETKAPNTPIKLGQRIFLDQLAALPEFHVVVLRGLANKPQYLQVLGYHQHPKKTDLEGVKSLFRRWYKYADKQTIDRSRPDISSLQTGYGTSRPYLLKRRATVYLDDPARTHDILRANMRDEDRLRLARLILKDAA